ncbi:3-oxoacyl-ACP reductase [Gordonia oryzae]|nr:3-oxoacyl-ACP reductase [Gordonia oryzae]
MSGALLISDHVVVVTGGARGLSAEMVRAAAGQVTRVVIGYRNSADAARTLADEIGDQAVVIAADITDRAAVDSMIDSATDHFDHPITAVVTNALPDYSFNGDARSHADDLTVAELDAQLCGIVGGALTTVQASLPGLRACGAGRIVTIGTNLVQNPVVPYHDYTAAKAALPALTRTLSAAAGISVTMVPGGLLCTTDAIVASTPRRSVTTPREFADAVLFFRSPWTRAVTGQNPIVDGALVKN